MNDVKAAIRQVQEGDLRAFGFVVRRFHDMAVGYAHSILGDFHEAEDVAQEAFVTAFDRLDQLSDPSAFLGWFRRIVHTKCDRVTRARRLKTVPLEASHSDRRGGDLPDLGLEKKELEARLRKAIATLNEPERVATTLFYISGYPQAEIAKFLSVPESTVKSRIHTARQSLKTTIVSDFEELVPETQPTHTYEGAHGMFKVMFPELFVSDVRESAAFFEDALGFKRGFTFEEKDGELDFAVMSHGSLTLYLHHMLPDTEAERPRYMRLYFEPHDIRQIHSDLKDEGLQCV